MAGLPYVISGLVAAVYLAWMSTADGDDLQSIKGTQC